METKILLRDHAWSTLSYSEVQRYLRQLKDPLTSSVEALEVACREFLEDRLDETAWHLFDCVDSATYHLRVAGFHDD